MRKLLKKHLADKVVDKLTDGYWLNKSHTINSGLTLLDEDKPVADQLLQLKPGARKIEEKKHIACNIISNLIYTNYLRIPLAVPMDRNEWKGKYFGLEFITSLLQQGLVECRKGTTYANRITRIWATKELLQSFQQHVEFIPEKWVALKDDDGNWIDYKPTDKTKLISKILEANFNINRKANIYLDGLRLCTALHAVFLNGWKYGRMHTNTDFGYQSFSSTERKSITFNGEESVELDYSGLHPRILYALEGIQYDDDPYEAVSEDNLLRPFLKTLLLTLLNSETENKAISAGNYEIIKQVERKQYAMHNYLKQIGLKPTDLIEQFKKTHEPIAHRFCSGIGMKLMRADSKIALEVINRCNSLSIPCLAIHDSFVVPVSHKETLHEIMAQAYSNLFDGYSCKIKS